MQGTVKAIYNLLKGDSTLVDLLAFNSPFNDPDGIDSRANSIVPADVQRTLDVPYLVILEGSELQMERHLHSEDIYIRCYNDINKSNITINEVLDRVRVLLDNQTFTIDDKSLVQCFWETTIISVTDETLQRKFKESRYRVLVL